VDRTQLKQRIVGAIVLVALAVIFIPIILDRGDGGISGSNIPDVPKDLAKLAKRPLPDTPSVPTTPETIRQIVDENTKKPPLPPPPTTSEQAKPPAQTVTEPKAQDKQGAQTLARAWVVQVASFYERDKALALRERLRKAEYITFVESLSNKQGVLYRVRVGPVVRREEAVNLQKKIIKQFKLKDALVLAHP